MKRMKYLLTFTVLDLSLFVNANVLEILSGKEYIDIDTHKNNLSINTLSLISYPELHQDGDTIFIDTNHTLSNLEIIITDMQGNVIQSKTITVYGGEEYT